MKLNFFENFFGSGFYTGYIPIASGTFGSLAAIIIYWIPGFEKPVVLIPAIIIFTFYGIFAAGKFEQQFGKDPAQCTIDEIVGMWISLLFLPKTFLVSIAAFLIWRAMDIIKPFPARQLENLKGGIGVMADDIAAAIYSLIIVHLLVHLINIA
ncbi:MAG: phosphatidylglycerophosphatase A [Ignavibacteriaceae bacterium]